MLNDKLVPALNVPAATAEAMAACRLAIVDDAPAVNEKVCPVAESVIDVTDPSVNAVLAVSGAEVVPSAELAELDGNASVSAAERFATLLLLFVEPTELMASSDGSLMDTLISAAALFESVEVVKKSWPWLPLESKPSVWAALKLLENWLAREFSCESIPGIT